MAGAGSLGGIVGTEVYRELVVGAFVRQLPRQVAELRDAAAAGATVEPSLEPVKSSAAVQISGIDMPASARQREDAYLTAAEAGRIVHVSPKTVSSWAKEGRLACRETLGGHRRFSRQEVDHLAERSRMPEITGR